MLIKIDRWQDIKNGDKVHTSVGEHTAINVGQYVAWCSLDVERQDGSSWNAQIHDGNWSLWHITREDIK